MCTNKIDGRIRAGAVALLLAALLAGCAKPAPAPEATPPATPPPAAPAVPEATPAEPATPAPEAPPPTEPSAAPKPAATNEPDVDSMLAAIPSAKMSVAAALRYRFESAVSGTQPATLHLAALPRATGANVRISVQQAEGLQVAPGPLRLQKAGNAEVYRQQVSVARLNQAAPAELWVLVTMETTEGSGFGYFKIPLGQAGGTNAQK